MKIHVQRVRTLTEAAAHLERSDTETAYAVLVNDLEDVGEVFRKVRHGAVFNWQAWPLTRIGPNWLAGVNRDVVILLLPYEYYDVHAILANAVATLVSDSAATVLRIDNDIPASRKDAGEEH